MVKAWQAIVSSQRKMRRRRNIRRRNVKLLVAPQSLPNDVVEEIFLRLPVETLIRLNCLSKQWRKTINSSFFAERHLKIAERRSSSHLKKKTIMVISEENPFQGVIDNKRRPDTDLSFNTICLETSSVLSSALINLPHGLSYFPVASTSCDGLFCIHSPLTQAVYVVNPATRWLRQLPPSGFQISILNLNLALPLAIHVKSVYHLAFVKVAANNDYKLIWFYNNNIFEGIDDDDGLVCGTKCEVFDFRANAWRYLPCTPSYKLYRDQTPAYANGSVYWFTEPHQGEIKVISLDINTEKFGFLPKLNRDIARSDPRRINMCTLDNRLCISKRESSSLVQDIWRLKSSSSSSSSSEKESSWEKIYTIDLLSCTSSKTEFRDEFDWIRKDVVEPCTPVAICEKSNEILLSHRYSRTIVKYDPVNKSMSLVFHRPLSKRFVPYFQSLISNI